MDIFKSYGTDPKKTTEGVWFDLGGKAKVKVARWGKSNSKFLHALFDAGKEHPGVFERTDPEAIAVQDKILREVSAETVLLDWEGLDWKGEPLPYSRENAIKVLALPEFNEVISGFAASTQKYLMDDEEVSVKKLPKR
jgi:hypothetical protein